MASGGQQLPTFPRRDRSTLVATGPRPRPQGSALAPPTQHTHKVALTALLGTLLWPVWAQSRGPLHTGTCYLTPCCRADTGDRAQQRWARTGQTTGVLGGTALQPTTPKKMPSQPCELWHPLAGTGPREVGAGIGWACAPRLDGALWLAFPAPCPLHQGLGSAKRPRWSESSPKCLAPSVGSNGNTLGSPETDHPASPELSPGISDHISVSPATD